MPSLLIERTNDGVMAKHRGVTRAAISSLLVHAQVNIEKLKKGEPLGKK